MKELISNKKVIYVLIGAIILIGMIIAFTIGFNYELKYAKSESIEIRIDKEFEINDISKLAKEVFNKSVKVEYVEEFRDIVLITSKEISEEKKTELIEKINEKYELNKTEEEGEEVSKNSEEENSGINAEDIQIIQNSQVSFYDIIKKAILPVIIASIIIIVYFMIMYRKIGIDKVALSSIIYIVVSQLLLFSIIAILRIPVGRYTMALILGLYVVVIYTLINKFEKMKR